MLDQLWAVLLAIIPSVGVGYLFYKVMRTIIEGDRRERLAYSQWLAEHGEGEPATGNAPTRRASSGEHHSRA